MAGTLVLTAANGLTNRTSTKLNPSWTGLTTNGTMYLYADVNADGTFTEGANSLLRVEQFGGTPAVTSGQHTYNIQQSMGYIGNGTTAPAGYRVYVGEVTVAAGVVSAIVWYSLMRRYVGPLTNTLPAAGAVVSVNHNLGMMPRAGRFVLRCLTAETGYVAGEEIDTVTMRDTANYVTAAPKKTRLTGSLGVASGFLIPNGGGGAILVFLTPANWAYRFEFEGGW